MPITTGTRDREFDLIERLSKKIPSAADSAPSSGVHLGIGDDGAVLRQSGHSEWVISCDFTLENVHFRGTTHPAATIGYRCLARAASDIAAMGAHLRFFLLALALPGRKTGRWLDLFASGMARAARHLNMQLIGGDLSCCDTISICTTVLGEIAPGAAVTRSGAKTGDLIYVTGTLGAAQLGLEILLSKPSHKRSLEHILAPHLYPRIPIELAQLLATRHIPSAMMDLSDGLSTDLARLCASSRVGARIFANKIPAVKIPRVLASQNFGPLAFALDGGEDYGLLFTVPPKSGRRLLGIATKTRITHIGEITRSRKVLLIHADGRERPLPARGWAPFR